MYSYVAKKRYSWFGKHDQCELPDQDVAAKFLSLLSCYAIKKKAPK